MLIATDSVGFGQTGKLCLCIAFSQRFFGTVKIPKGLNADEKVFWFMTTPIHKSWMTLIVLILVSAVVPMVGATGEGTWHLRNDVAAGFDYPAGHEYD